MKRTGGSIDSYTFPVGTNDGDRFILSFTALGTAFEDRIVIRVRWEWLFVPVSLVLITGALTMGTKIRGSKRHLPAWGSSTTALMIHGPYSHTEEAFPQILTAKQMHDKAKSTKVLLERNFNGSWRLFTREDRVVGSNSMDLESTTSRVPHPTAYRAMTERRHFLVKRRKYPCCCVEYNEGTTSNFRATQGARLARSRSI